MIDWDKAITALKKDKVAVIDLTGMPSFINSCILVRDTLIDRGIDKDEIGLTIIGDREIEVRLIKYSEVRKRKNKS